ncbi:MAG TPA: hypothetical protein VJ864_03260, partial [Candidatus Binatia bacterium]|nr:hypothetical protein [Candidatus Binatia bacterium]
RNLLLFILVFALAAGLVAQTPSPVIKPSAITGEVVSITDAKIIIQTATGPLDVMLTPKTEYKRVPPENPTPSAAVPAVLADISAGDKLLVTGILSEDKKSLPARSVYLIKTSDIAQKQAKEAQAWATRGITGRVASTDQLTNQIKIEVRGLMNTTTVVLTPKADARFRRYAPNSIKYGDAKQSNLTEIQPGDMLRALGDRSPDGASFSAEEIVTGAFQTVAGTVKSVDAEKNEVVIADMQSKKDVTIDLGSATVLKRFPPEMAERMAQFQGGRPGGGPGSPGGMRPSGQAGPPAGAGQTGQGGPGAGGPGRGGARGGIGEMLERFPNITAADLKPGDVIAVSSSKSQTDRITAIKLLAGVEPFLRAAQAQAAASGGQRGQGTLSLDIPGLDGFGGP